MKKAYKQPLTEAIVLKAKFCFLENSGELGDKEDDYESKSSTFDSEGLHSEPKSVNLWSDDEEQEN